MFFLKIWEIPKFWEISQILGNFGKFPKIRDQGDFLVLLDARDCIQMD
jgi:hypothetical protein